MARYIVLFTLCVSLIACSHSDGLRVEWSETPRVRANEPDLVVEEEPAGDLYALEIDSMLALASSIAFMDPADGHFVLRELDCTWQRNRCLETYRRRCSDMRLFRNSEWIDTERMRLRACTFSLEADPD